MSRFEGDPILGYVHGQNAAERKKLSAHHKVTEVRRVGSSIQGYYELTSFALTSLVVLVRRPRSC